MSLNLLNRFIWLFSQTDKLRVEELAAIAKVTSYPTVQRFGPARAASAGRRGRRPARPPTGRRGAACKPRCQNFNANECNQCNNCRRTEICDKVPKCKQFCVGNTVEEKTAACMATCNLGKERCATCNRECPDTAGR